MILIARDFLSDRELVAAVLNALVELDTGTELGAEVSSSGLLLPPPPPPPPPNSPHTCITLIIFAVGRFWRQH